MPKKAVSGGTFSSSHILIYKYELERRGDRKDNLYYISWHLLEITWPATSRKHAPFPFPVLLPTTNELHTPLTT